jgi:hypothetical protein
LWVKVSIKEERGIFVKLIPNFSRESAQACSVMVDISRGGFIPDYAVQHKHQSVDRPRTLNLPLPPIFCVRLLNALGLSYALFA